MNLQPENKLNADLTEIFKKLELDTRFAVVKVSDRADLSDFQCNGALALAKIAHKNPREIAQSIAEELKNYPEIEAVSVDGPGFINIKLTNEFIAETMDKMAADERLGCGMTENPHKVVLDFGGPNVAKEMHVGHLRSGVIGESIQRIERFAGNKVISDVHLGDWGTPMGMILAEIIHQDGDLSKIKVEKLCGFSNGAEKTQSEQPEKEKSGRTRINNSETKLKHLSNAGRLCYE